MKVRLKAQGTRRKAPAFAKASAGKAKRSCKTKRLTERSPFERVIRAGVTPSALSFKPLY